MYGIRVIKIHIDSCVLNVHCKILCDDTHTCMGARRYFSRGGQNHRQFKKLTRFRRAVQKTDHSFGAPKSQTKTFCVFAAVLDLNIGYLWRAPEARAKNLGYFVGRQHMTSFFQIPRGGKCPPCGRPCVHVRLSLIRWKHLSLI